MSCNYSRSATRQGLNRLFLTVDVEVRFLTGAVVCTRNVHREESVQWLKRRIEGETGIAQCNQDLVVGSRKIGDLDVFGDLFPTDEFGLITLIQRFPKELGVEWQRYHSEGFDCPVYYNELTGEQSYVRDDPETIRTFNHAAFHGDLDAVVSFLSQGIGADSFQQYYIAWNLALEGGQVEVLKVLMPRLLHSAGVSELSQDDLVPSLHLGCKVGNVEIVRWLLVEHGANPELKGVNGDNALHVACLYGHSEIVEELLRGFNSEFVAEEETTLINSAVLDQLARMEGLMGAANKFGDTPLHLAALKGHLPVVECLLAVGADFNAKRFNSHTAEACAFYRGHMEVAALLRERRLAALES